MWHLALEVTWACERQVCLICELETQVKCVNGCRTSLGGSWVGSYVFACSWLPSLLLSKPSSKPEACSDIEVGEAGSWEAVRRTCLLWAVYSTFLPHHWEIIEKRLNSSPFQGDFWSSCLVIPKGPVGWMHSETVLTKWNMQYVRYAANATAEQPRWLQERRSCALLSKKRANIG